MKFERLRKHFDDIYRMATGCLEKLPEEKFHFKAHPELRTPAELFYHMYINHDWYLRSMDKCILELDDYKKLIKSMPETRDDLRRYIDGVYERGQTFLKNSVNAAIVCSTSEGDRTAYDMMINDYGIQYYHLGQIFAVYRLIDLTTPDYGEALRIPAGE